MLKLFCGKKYLEKKIDITIQDSKHFGLQCVELVKRILGQYKQLKPLVLVLKQFAFQTDFNDTYHAFLIAREA